MRVGFTGSRGYPRADLVSNFVAALARKYPDTIVVSGGRGNVDIEAEQAGIRAGLEVISFAPADKEINVREWDHDARAWKEHPMLGCGTFVANCFFRNGLIAESGRVVGFWDLSSHGTANCLKKAKQKGRPRTVYGPDGLLLDDTRVDALVQAVSS